MAVIQNQQQDEENQQQQQQAPAPTTGAGGIAPVTQTGATPAPKAPVQAGGSSGRIQNLQKYIQANKNVNYGQQLTGAVQEKVGQLGQQVGQAKNTLQQRAAGDLARVRGRENFLQQAVADPTKFVQNQQQFDDFTKLRTGDIGTYNVQNIQDIMNQQQKVADFGNLGKTEQGRQQMFRNVYGGQNYTKGQSALDNLLLRGSQLRDLQKGTAGAVEAAGQEITGLQGAETELNKELVEGRKAAQEAIQAGLLGEQGAIPGFIKDLEGRTKAARDTLRGQQESLSSKLQRGADLSESDLKELEFATPQEQDQFLSYYDRSRAGVKYSGAAGPDLDFSRYFDRTDPISGITEQKLASADDYSKYGALRRLAGQERALLQDEKMAGTAMTDLGKANSRNALLAALQYYSPKTYGEYETAAKAESEKVQQAKNVIDMLRRYSKATSSPSGMALEADKALLDGKLTGTPGLGAGLEATANLSAAPQLTALNQIEAGIATEGTATDKGRAIADVTGQSMKDYGVLPQDAIAKSLVAQTGNDNLVGATNLALGPQTWAVQGAADTATVTAKELMTGADKVAQGDVVEGVGGMVAAPTLGMAAAATNVEEQIVKDLSKATGIKEIDDANQALVTMARNEPEKFKELLKEVQQGDISGSADVAIQMVKMPGEALDKALGTSVFGKATKYIDPMKALDVMPFTSKLMEENRTVSDVLSGRNITSAAQNVLRGSVGGAAQSAFNKAVDTFRPRGGGGGGGGCFIAGTLVTMKDGSRKPVQMIQLGDELMYGGKVFGLGQIMVEEVYCHKNSVVSGTHAVFENGTWLRVEESEEAIPFPIEADYVVVYPIATEHHLMYVNDVFYADFAETEQGTSVTDKDRIAYMNADADRNAYLMEQLNVKKH